VCCNAKPIFLKNTTERRRRESELSLKVNEFMGVAFPSDSKEVIVYQRAVVTDQMRTFNPPPVNDPEPECFNDWSKFKFSGSVQD
jgi:hypothetical protein